MEYVSLKNIPLFSGLGGKTGRKLVSIANEKSFKKGETVFNVWDRGSTLFFLLSGSVKFSLVDERGREVILKILYGGDFFGEMSLFNGGFRSASVVAIEESRALIIHQKEFYSLIKHPEIAMQIVINLSMRIRKLDEKVANLALSDSIGKVASLLLELYKEIGEKKNGEAYFKTNLTRQEMANMIGITRETFIRCLHTFQERGLIAVSGKRITIKREVDLKREIS